MASSGGGEPPKEKKKKRKKEKVSLMNFRDTFVAFDETLALYLLHRKARVAFNSVTAFYRIHTRRIRTHVRISINAYS